MSKENETNIVSMRDFYNHDTRICLLEKSVSDIAEILKELKQDIQNVRIEVNDLRKDMKHQFYWLLSLILSSNVGMLTIIAKSLHWLK